MNRNGHGRPCDHRNFLAAIAIDIETTETIFLSGYRRRQWKNVNGPSRILRKPKQTGVRACKIARKQSHYRFNHQDLDYAIGCTLTYQVNLMLQIVEQSNSFRENSPES